MKGEHYSGRTRSTGTVVFYSIYFVLLAAALSAALSGEKCSVSYSAPTEKTGEFQCSGFSLSLDRVYRGEKFWTAQVKLHAAFVPEDGL